MATSSFYLKVISANRVFFAGKCRSLIVPEFDGQKEILAHHEDMVIAIDEGQMKFSQRAATSGFMLLLEWDLLKSSTTV